MNIDTAHAAALAKNGDPWIAALLDEIDRLAQELDDAYLTHCRTESE